MRRSSFLTLVLFASLPTMAAPAKKPVKPAPKSPAKKAPKPAPKTMPKPPVAAVKPPATAEPVSVEIGTLTGIAPGTWTAQPPIGQFRLAQYALPKAGGDTNNTLLIVFHFGKGGGGTVEDNVKRWYGMMQQPDGRSGAAVAKRAEATREGLKITSVDIPGTYLDRPFPFSNDFVPRENYRMLAAIIETTLEAGDGPYYLRIVGPAKSVEAAREGWEKLLKSVEAR